MGGKKACGTGVMPGAPGDLRTCTGPCVGTASRGSKTQGAGAGAIEPGGVAGQSGRFWASMRAKARSRGFVVVMPP